MDELILKILYLVTYVTTVFIQFPHRRRIRKNRTTIDQKTNLEKALTINVLIGFSALPLLYVFTPYLDFADFYLPYLAHITGIVLIVPSLWLYYRSHTDLGHNWSPTLVIHDKQTLITKGIYSQIRHPMYAAIWLLCTIQALLINNYIAGPSGLVTFGLLYFLRVGHEENMMRRQFGNQYEEFVKTTNRLIPKLKSRQKP